MQKGSILVVDDEPELRTLLSSSLGAAGYAVTTAGDGGEALAVASTQPLDLMILDLGLPTLPGFEVCRRLRRWSRLPVIVLSVRDDEEDKIAALDLGANDYLTKPFGMGELLARIRATLRDSAAQAAPTSDLLRFGELYIDLAQRQVLLEGQHVYLTRKEYELLLALARHAGAVRSYQQLLHELWGDASERDLRTLRVLMGQLRRKLDDASAQQRFIFTESGVGYRFRPRDE
jgi:two-component system, OmpR family, KDP operon response regulator KdpE